MSWRTTMPVATKPRVRLQFDSATKEIVARKDQIGLSWHSIQCAHVTPTELPRDLGVPASSVLPRYGLAQVADVPEELFQLDDLTTVLTSKSWRECLSSGDRDQLRKLLPAGMEAEAALRPLLRGDDVHFGSPLRTWGKGVCQGEAHPDKIAEQDEKLRGQRRGYLRGLRQYHARMLELVQGMRGIWEGWGEGSLEGLPSFLARWREQYLEQLASSAPLKLHPFAPAPQKRRKPGPHHGQLSKEEADYLADEAYVRWRLKKRRLDGARHVSPLAPPAAEAAFPEWATRSGAPSPGPPSGSEGANEPGRRVQLSKEQFEEVVRRRQGGEELRWDWLKPLLGAPSGAASQEGQGSPRGEHSRQQREQERLAHHWHTLVHADLPAVHALAVRAREDQAALAKWLAEQCVQQRTRLRPIRGQACQGGRPRPPEGKAPEAPHGATGRHSRGPHVSAWPRGPPSPCPAAPCGATGELQESSCGLGCSQEALPCSN